MMSTPAHTSGLRSRQRQHRRQNSTPSAFDAVKIAPLPTLQPKRPISHRRGLSLDTRAHPLAPAPAPTESQTSSQQSTPRRGFGDAFFPPSDGSDNFLFSPQVTPQSRRFANILPHNDSMEDLNSLSFDQYAASLGLYERPDSRLSGSDVDPSRDFDFFGADSALSTPSFLTFPESSPAPTQGWSSDAETASTNSRRSSRRISNAILDKVAKFEALGAGASMDRPCTPNGQTNSFFSQTPSDTSAKQDATPQQQRPNRFSEGYDESMEETLKPIRKRTDNRHSGIFQDLRKQAEAMMQKTPPRTSNIPMAIPNTGLQTPDFMNMRSISAEFRKLEEEFGTFPTSPVTEASSAFNSIVNSSQESLAEKPALQPAVALQPRGSISLAPPSPSRKSPSRRTSPHRRTESLASLASAASIADINIEETRTETGVTLEDIAAYIQGPDPTDGKWRCTYEGCNKLFGRKENIKSHVQTHLNDRQYRCPTCKKCFVRQHDLKRHAKIHTGIKPYPCECGNSFARHDALTRHRQRGMCIGAFDGVVRKVVKRGRPKKIRPEMDERRDKAERTRRKNKMAEAAGMSSASSVSGCSDVSGASSPSNEFDGLIDEDQFPGLLSAAINPGLATIHPTTLSVSSAPMPTTAADSFHTALSPSAMSNYSHASNHPSPALSTSLLPTTASSTGLTDLTATTAPPIPTTTATSRPSSPTKPTRRYTSPLTAPSPSATPSSASTTAQQQQQQQQTTASPAELVSSPSSPPPLLSASTFSSSTVSSAATTVSLSAAAARFFDLDGTDDDDFHIAAREGGDGAEDEVGDVSIGLGTTVAARAAASAIGSSEFGMGQFGLGGLAGMGLGGGLGMAGLDGLGGATTATEFGAFGGSSAAAGNGGLTSSPSPLSSGSTTSTVESSGSSSHVLLDQQGMLLGGGGGQMGKFDALKFVEDEFDPVSMFTHGEDVFFGTPA